MSFTLRHASSLNLLLVGMGRHLDEDSYMHAYRAVRYVVATRGPCSGVVDFSKVEAFDLPGPFLRQIGEMKPAFPPGCVRCVVAPDPALYGVARMVQAYRSQTGAPLLVYRDLDQALRQVGAKLDDFADIDLFRVEIRSF